MGEDGSISCSRAWESLVSVKLAAIGGESFEEIASSFEVGFEGGEQEAFSELIFFYFVPR